MSYTLRGRLESRLAAAALPFLAACGLAAALDAWWPLQLAGTMVAVGLAFDVGAYHRLIPYQAGWLALPLGAAELGATMGLALALDVPAPLGAALAFFAGSWLWAQVLAHAALPLLHLTYAEDGGELGRAGTTLLGAAPVAVAAVLGVAWASQPPTVHLEAGVHQGPLVLDRSQKLVGEPGTVVRGGIVVTADDVTVRDVWVVGGEIGIEVRDAERVLLERVRVSGATRDGISARRSSLVVRDCAVLPAPGEYAQGIDISFAMHEPPSLVEDCTVSGGREGIVAHMVGIRIRDNVIRGTTLQGISMTEMSMGRIDGNDVRGALGVAIFCGDMSHCEVDGNRISGTRPDGTVRSRAGFGIVSHYHSVVTLGENDNADGVGAFIGSRVERD